MEQYKKDFIERTDHHIELVNYYALEIAEYDMDVFESIDVKYHDEDKLTTLLEDYSLMSKESLTPEEEKRLDEATKIHIIYNYHHPEFWVSDEDTIRVKREFTRKNPVMNLDCSNMPEWAMMEMCADWCAMSEEFSNTPFEWADKVIGTRWIFTDNQKEFIYDTLRKGWSSHMEEFN